MKARLRELHEFREKKVYLDLYLSSALAWVTGFVACLPYGSFTFQVLALMAAMIFFSRAISFSHEVVHLEHKSKKLGILFDLMIGYWARLPLYIFRLHLAHHSTAKFGSSEDPEHLDLRKRNLFFFLPFKLILEPLFTPLILLIRYTIITLVYLVAGKNAQEFVFKKMSTVHFDSHFTRKSATPAELKEMQRSDAVCLAISLIQIGAAIGFHNWKILGVWSLSIAFLSSTAFLRTIVLHNYTMDHHEGGGTPLSKLMRTTVSVESAPLAAIWAPFDFRYHALHHLHPGIPYYHLQEAHQLILENEDENHFVAETIQPSFASAFRAMLADHSRERKKLGFD